MNLADSHYRTLETKGQEPIDRMESIVCRGIPEEFHEIARRNLNMALASKHEDRAGEKSGEDWRKELTKAQNYMHRAVHGCWIGNGASDKESLGVGDGTSWRIVSIGTAPKDGTWIVARTSNGRHDVAVQWARGYLGSFDWIDSDGLVRDVSGWFQGPQEDAEHLARVQRTGAPK